MSVGRRSATLSDRRWLNTRSRVFHQSLEEHVVVVVGVRVDSW